MNIETRLRSIVGEIDDQIAADMRSLAGEQRWPTSNADESDDKMRDLKARIVKLRAFRNEIEEVMTGASL